MGGNGSCRRYEGLMRINTTALGSGIPLFVGQEHATSESFGEGVESCVGEAAVCFAVRYFFFVAEVLVLEASGVSFSLFDPGGFFI